jgi:hypothetical protein
MAMRKRRLVRIDGIIAMRKFGPRKRAGKETVP